MQNDELFFAKEEESEQTKLTIEPWELLVVDDE